MLAEEGSMLFSGLVRTSSAGMTESELVILQTYPVSRMYMITLECRGVELDV